MWRKQVKGKKRVRRIGGEDNAQKKELYFGPDTQSAIYEFKSTDDPRERDAIYSKRILPALDKLVENLIRIYAISSHDNVSEIQNDCVSFLYENLKKFDEKRGTKAFSYFNVVARNWLFLYSRRRSKFNGRHISLSDMNSLSPKDKMQVAKHIVVDSPEDIMVREGRRDEIKEVLEKVSACLREDHEKACMQAIMSVFEHVDDIDILHKRAIMIYVRDLSNLPQKQLTMAMSSIRKHYKKLNSEMNGT
jgi:hypothetical protein